MIDTNVLASSLYRLAIRQGFVRPCLSEAIIAEYAAVLARPKFAFPPEEIEAVLAMLQRKRRLPPLKERSRRMLMNSDRL